MTEVPVFVDHHSGQHFAAESAAAVAIAADVATITPTTRWVLAERIGLISADHPQLWPLKSLVSAYNRDHARHR